MITLYDFMRRKPSRIRHDAKVKEAAWQMQERRIAALLVEEKRRVVGIITAKDVIKNAHADGRDENQIYVHQIMSRLVLRIEAGSSPREALMAMAKHAVSYMVVTEGGTVVGIVSDKDILTRYSAVAESNIDVA